VLRAGPRKILFGSDGPWLHPGVELAKVRALGMPPSQERLVLGNNFLRLTRAARMRFWQWRNEVRQVRHLRCG